MFPFWDIVIEPVFRAMDAKRVVEVGALRGENTVQMLDALSEDAELHVVDPVPDFDPDEHARQFGGRYVFHRALSLEVLDQLPTCDVALLDGDHNWYTVYNELRQLDERARLDGEPFPVTILHDVCFPYARRDLYYAPETIPEEFRQPYEQAGILRGQSELAKVGGMNPTMYNATHEGGPRNGVMTGIEDFVAETDRNLRQLVLPIYFGLAILVEDAQLARHPELVALLDRLEAAEGKDDLLELAESTRLDAMNFQHNIFYHREAWLDRLTTRYLDTLRDGLLDLHGIENEVRIGHLMDCIERGSQPVPAMLRDPRRSLKDKTRRMRSAKESGLLRTDRDELASLFPTTRMGRVAFDHLRSCLDDVRRNQVPGDLVEAGTGRGGGAVFMRGYLDAWNMPFPRVWVADRFRASTPSSADDLDALAEIGADLNNVRDTFEDFDLFDDRVKFLVGDPAVALKGAPLNRIAVLRLGEGLGDEVGAVLDAAYDMVLEGGHVVVGEADDPIVVEQVKAFRQRRGISAPLEHVDAATITWKNDPDASAPAAEAPDALPATEAGAALPAGDGEPGPSGPGTTPPNAPLSPGIVLGRLDLTVVVVFYNMRREAARTLHSLTRAYQRGIEDLDYEVLVIENGSAPDQKLGAEYVRSFGPEFRYIDMGEDAKPSPVAALNVGLAKGRGGAFALMIDGAHVLSPGVLRYGMLGLETYEPAIVGTQQWYVGPGQQGDVLADGYDQELEDQLFADIEWPNDGYRLFDIGHFIGDRDWLDGLWESNCLFVPRTLVAQAGGYDESFDVAGGSYANLEIYERLGATPGVTAVTILGEGSFHQSHGGTTTNQPDLAERNRRIASYAAEYAELRGRPFKGLDKQMHYVGSITWEACRTRARRRVAPNLFKRNTPGDPDGRPDKPTPMPEDLVTAYLDAYWRSYKWREVSWMGVKAEVPPGDLLAYQEIVAEVRPDWIIETSVGSPGGRALFLAAVCDELGHGKVISIDPKPRPDLPRHDRIVHIEGKAHEQDVVAQVRTLVGEDPHALAIIATKGARLRTIMEFEAFEPFVRTGSYIVVENTILNGNPVWASFGLGPREAVRQLLVDHRDFTPDISIDKRYPAGFNPGGWLKRVRNTSQGDTLDDR